MVTIRLRAAANLSALLSTLALAVFALPLMGQLPDSFRAVIAQNASGCVTSTLDCGGSSSGTLGIGDCTFSDGTYYDRYTFAGKAGDLVTIDVRPMSSTLTNPMIVLAPPAGDASRTPIIYGGSGASVRYVLSSSGTWVLAVGTHDLLASGDYFVGLTCERNLSPNEPQNCVTQELICGQTAAWYLTAQSCRFSDGSSLYQDFEIYGVAGDTVSVTMLSADFVPMFGILSEKTNNYIGNATVVNNSKAQQTLTFPEIGFYAIVATSRDDLKSGFFSLSVSCFASGCMHPVIVAQPAAKTTVVAGSRVTLSLTANGTKPLSYTWLEFPGVTAASGPSFTSAPLFFPTSYYATVTNPCGSATTKAADVMILTTKRRAVGHR